MLKACQYPTADKLEWSWPGLLHRSWTIEMVSGHTRVPTAQFMQIYAQTKMYIL